VKIIAPFQMARKTLTDILLGGHPVRVSAMGVNSEGGCNVCVAENCLKCLGVFPLLDQIRRKTMP
jgi:hypothetical protein